MNWFQANAPIRLKLLLAFGLFVGLLAADALSDIFLPGTAAIEIACGLTLVAAVSAWWLREAIAVPYVSTVVRMEGLAAGDLVSPIAYTDYSDCVGRLTRAMFSFKRGAEEQVRINALAQEHAAVVRGMAAYFQRLAGGDLSAKIVEDYPDEFSELKDGYNAAIDRLRDLIVAVSDRATAIGTGTGEIAQASENLARRTEANAASLEETAAALAQMDQRLKVTATAAAKTVARADGATGTVESGRETTNAAVQAMNRVADSAKGIDSVIEGLDKIAFQTRVLAMNAAVEAGRAGEAGRGFAVVADLVSALAMRAEEEAGRAREQLTSTQTDIVAAVAMVQQVDGALAGIAADVAEVHDLLGSMAGDNQAQSSGLTQISSAVGTMDQSTQQNAAMVEETSAAAQSLMGEVQALIAQANRFDVGDRGTERKPSAMSPARRAPSARPKHVSPVTSAERREFAATAGEGEWASF